MTPPRSAAPSKPVFALLQSPSVRHRRWRRSWSGIMQWFVRIVCGGRTRRGCRMLLYQCECRARCAYCCWWKWYRTCQIRPFICSTGLRMARIVRRTRNTTRHRLRVQPRDLVVRRTLAQAQLRRVRSRICPQYTSVRQLFLVHPVAERRGHLLQIRPEHGVALRRERPGRWSRHRA